MPCFKTDQDPCLQRNSFKHQPFPLKRKNFEKTSNLSFTHTHTHTQKRDGVNITKPSKINYSSYLKKNLSTYFAVLDN